MNILDYVRVILESGFQLEDDDGGGSYFHDGSGENENECMISYGDGYLYLYHPALTIRNIQGKGDDNEKYRVIEIYGGPDSWEAVSAELDKFREWLNTWRNG